jgi:hypothetical protein
VDPSSRSADALGGFAWVAAWAATSLFAAGAILLVVLIVTRVPDPFAGTAFLAVAICVFGVAVMTVASAAWLTRLVLDRRTSRRRGLAAIFALAGAAAALAALLADQLGALDLPSETWPFALAGVTLLALGTILAAPPTERRPAVTFGLVWAVLVAVLGYTMWTS